MKKVFFIDFDGVLSYVPFWHSLKDPNHELHNYLSSIENFLFKENSNLVNEWMTGKHSSEDIHRIISKNLNISYSSLFEAFEKDCKDMKVSKKVLNKLSNLKKDYYLILSTGNMDSFDRFTLPSEKYLFKVFDQIHNSFNLGMLKTSNNGEYFKNVVRDKKVSFSNCYLIDDSQKACNLFEILGGKAYCAKKEDEVLNFLNLL
ncbi:MAG: hypothetical protein V1829_01410 [bacterium]